jgi:hypothetical protein
LLDYGWNGQLELPGSLVGGGLGGDSGGLWVNETGEAVGIQLMAGGDFAWLHPMTLVMDYFKKHYDGSLRFLKASDLAKMSMP